MTSRERLLTALKGGTPDRVPVAPFGLGKLDPAGPVAAELIRTCDPFISVGASPDPFLGASIPVEWQREPNALVQVMHLPGGDLVRRTEWNEATSAVTVHPFRTRGDAERFLATPYTPPEPDLTAYRTWKERIGSEGFVLAGIENPLCLPAAWFSPEEFCFAWAEVPDLVEALVKAATARLLPYVEAMCKAGVEGFRIVGGEYASVQLGPAAFRRLAVPYDRALVDVIHRHGAIAYYHNHGKVRDLLPDLASIGMDALDPLEAPPWGDVADLGAARRAVDGRVCLVGNLDDMEVLERGDPDDAVRLGRERLRLAGRTGFILGGTASGSYGERAANAFMALAKVSMEEAPG